MATVRARETGGPDIWAISAGWIALFMFVLTLNHLAYFHGWTEGWALLPSAPALTHVNAAKCAIATLAFLIMWVLGYGPRIVEAAADWTRRGGLNAAAVTVGILIAAVFVNYLFHRYHWQKDLTKDQRYTLNDRTLQILRGLKEPVQVTAFFQSAGIRGGRAQADNLLRQYAWASDKFKYALVDPIDRIDLLKEKGMTSLEGVVFEYKGKKQQLTQVTEQEFTNTLLKMTKEKQPKAYFLQGHGEMSFERGAGTEDLRRSLSEAAERLTNSQWKLEKLLLRGAEAKTPDPADAGVIIIADPLTVLGPDEMKRLTDYLEKGGRVLALLSPDGQDLKAILNPYGIESANDYVYDLNSGSELLIERPESQSHPLTSKFSVMDLVDARSVSASAKPPPGITAQSLFKSGPNSISSPKRLQRGQLKPNAPGTKKGPFSLAAVGTRAAAPGKPESRMIAIGSSLSFSDIILMQSVASRLFNANFFANCVNWLGEQTELLTIEPKQKTDDTLPVTPQKGTLLALIFYLEFPVLAVALGIYVYLKRR